MADGVISRSAVRAVLLTPDSEVLLMRIRLEGADAFWITPGGGIETGENAEDGLRRELREEVGLDNAEIGPLVWRRQHTFDFGGARYCQNERYFVVHVPRFDPIMSDTVEAAVFDRFRWWKASELHHASERLTPLSLASIVENYLRDGPPKEIPDIEILVD